MLGHDRHQGVVAVVSPIQYDTFEAARAAVQGLLWIAHLVVT